MHDASTFPLPTPPTVNRVAWRRMAGDVPAALGILAATLVFLVLTGFIGALAP